MLQRHISFDETEQVCSLYEYMALRAERFLDYDPVPFPPVENGESGDHDDEAGSSPART